MPKETITARTTYPVDTDGFELDSEHPDADKATRVVSPQLEVYWSKPESEFGEHVQIAIEVDAAHTNQRAKQNGAEDPAVVANWFFTDNLDRNAINKLIRVLRRARDQAFGSDE